MRKEKGTKDGAWGISAIVAYAKLAVIVTRMDVPRAGGTQKAYGSSPCRLNRAQCDHHTATLCFSNTPKKFLLPRVLSAARAITAGRTVPVFVSYARLSDGSPVPTTQPEAERPDRTLSCRGPVATGDETAKEGERCRVINGTVVRNGWVCVLRPSDDSISYVRMKGRI